VAAPSDDDQTLLTQLATTVWGAFGNNGLNRKSQEHSEQIGELFGKHSQLSEELERRLGGIYRMLATLTVSMLVGAVGIIATLVVTKG
jgi:hypothetical protein